MNLKNLIHAIRDTFGILVSIHDVTGITYTNWDLQLDYSEKIHDCEWCVCVKKTLGQVACTSQKRAVMRRLVTLNGQGLSGICMMGVSEYVVPVIAEGRLLAVVFVSGAAKEDSDIAWERVRRRAERTQSPQDICDAFQAFCESHTTTRRQLEFFGNLVADLILSHADTMISSHSAPASEHPWSTIYPARSHSTSSIIEALLPYMQKHFRHNYSLSHYANMFFVTPQYLCRIFSKEMGQSPMSYISHLRIRYASEELLRTDLRVVQIAQNAGFSDVNYFCRLFKKSTGLTPSAYRSQHHL